MRSISKVAAAGIVAAAIGGVPASAAVPAAPAGRAYERITSHGTPAPLSGAAVSDDGTQVAFRWAYPLPEAGNGFISQQTYLGQRTNAGWQVSDLAPWAAGQRPPEFFTGDPNNMRIVMQTAGSQLGVDAGIWRRELDGSLTELLRIPAPTATTAPPLMFAAGASDDGSHVFVQSQAKLSPDALSAPNFNLYELTPEGMRLASRDPFGNAISAKVGSFRTGDPAQPSAVSQDGHVMVMQDANDPNHAIYARVDGTTSVDVSASQRTTPDPRGPQIRDFQQATKDGRLILFTSSEELTDDAVTGGSEDDGFGSLRDLYQYDMESGALRTLTPGFDPDVPPRVMAVVALADDASVVYFVARAALPNSAAVEDGLNLYRYDAHSDNVRFIGTLSSSLSNDVSSDIDGVEGITARNSKWHTTANGRRLLFESTAPLTGPEASDANGGERVNVFIYDDAGGDLKCLSCGPSGTRVAGHSAFSINVTQGNIPAIPGPSVGPTAAYSLARVMSDDGRRIFFTTRNALVPQDVNARWDVYEYDDGTLRLISPGDGPYDARFEGTTPDGDDVIIATDEPLVSSDDDVNSDLYAVRAGGGFAEPTDPRAPCAADACQGPPTRQSSPPVAASITFAGPPSSDLPRFKAPPLPPTPLKLSVTKKAVRGTAVTISVKVPAAGRITVTGSRTSTARRTASRSGTYALRVRLTASGRRALRRHHRMKLSLRVGYLARQGRAQSMIVTVSLKG